VALAGRRQQGPLEDLVPARGWDLLDQHARKHGYPTELLISFVREESAFDPLRESFANAIGLTQMIAPTAKRFAKGTGIKVSRLKDGTIPEMSNEIAVALRPGGGGATTGAAARMKGN